MIAEAETPTTEEMALAAESARRLAPLLRSHLTTIRADLAADGRREDAVCLPAAALRLLVDILNEMSRGKSVAVVPVDADLTTQQAADLLNVSRPFLIGLLESRQIPYGKVGTHRRIRFADLLAYKQRDDRERETAADALAAEAQELGLGY